MFVLELSNFLSIETKIKSKGKLKYLQIIIRELEHIIIKNNLLKVLGIINHVSSFGIFFLTN